MERVCNLCSNKFTIPASVFDYYLRISPRFSSNTRLIPPPRLCPECRQQRRLCFRNERTLYHRTCDASKKRVISIYPPDSRYTVYDNAIWWSDKWNPLDYGREYDFRRPFFEQFQDLYDAVPKAALIASNNENSQFVNYAVNCKDCYLILGWGEKSEHCMYGKLVINCRDCLDISHAEGCELCYQCVDIDNCYRLFYAQSCKHCSESYYLKNCIGCSNCFGCINLVNKQYHIFNRPHSRTEYQQQLPELLAADSKQAGEESIAELFDSAPYKYYQGINTEYCTGDYLRNCKNASYCFDTSDTEDGLYLYDCIETRNCMDLTVAGKNNTELSYECVNYTGQHCLFVSLVWFSNDLLYCQDCFHGCHDCFGCTGLVHKEYCILNKQYERDDYLKLCQRIIEQMTDTGEWGEFFPPAISPFGYNESMAQEYFPLDKSTALAHGFKWTDTSNVAKACSTVAAKDLPQDAHTVGDEILDWVIACEATNKPFRIVKEELTFYRENSLPLPRLHPDERHRLRLKLRNPRTLWQRNCQACGTTMKSTFSPEMPQKVFCEPCFLAQIY